MAVLSPISSRRLARRMTGLTLLFLVGAAASTQAQQDVPATVYKPDEIEKFCGNIADAARERRNANQVKELEALKSEIDKRVEQLEAKRAEYEKWMRLREDFMDQANEQVVKIYARMRPDAAAERLTELTPELAAAIMMKLEVKQSGLIFNEMERSAAAKLTGIMAAAAREDNPT